MSYVRYKEKQEQFLGLRPPRRLSIAGTSSIYETGVVYTYVEQTKTLEAAKAYKRWLAVMAVVSEIRNSK